MSDLISRSALTKELDALFTNFLWGLSLVKHMVKNAPAVDAVEVVRCWQCRYSSVIPHTELYLCRKAYTGCRADFFCADGERRTDA